MNNLKRWIDQNEMPFLTNFDRLVSVLYILGIATREQLSIILGWTENQVHKTLQQIRKRVEMPAKLRQEKDRLERAKRGELQLDEVEFSTLRAVVREKTKKLEAERDKWLTIYRPVKNSIAFYTLGQYGVEHACSLREEPFQRWKISPLSQIHHFTGVVDILVRYRKAGLEEADWLSAKEVERELYYYWGRYQRKTKKSKKERLPCKPDAYIQLQGGEEFFLEYDTGTESTAKLRSRFQGYLKLYEALGEVEAYHMCLPVIWIVRNKNRIQKIEQVAQEVMEDWQADRPGREILAPNSTCLVEGEETKFFCGEIEPKPFW